MTRAGSRWVSLAVVCALWTTACATEQPPVGEPNPMSDGTSGQTEGTIGATEDTEDTETALGRYLELGREKVDQGAIAEGIKNYVYLLAEIQRMSHVSAEARNLGATAQEELNRVGAALTLAAGVEWMDPDKNQLAANTLDVGTPQGRNPSVTLTYSLGNTATVVGGAPVEFEFVRGSGALVTPVTTNEFGQANTTVTSLGDVRAENIIRAAVVFRVGGATHRFPGASRDFAYLPPVRKATILVLEKAVEDGRTTYVSPEPVALDPVYNVLRQVDFDYTAYRGRLGDDRYQDVFRGDKQAIQDLALEEGVSFLVMVQSVNEFVRQVELNGVKYRLFASQTSAATEIIRVADGSVLYSAEVRGVKGQGATAEEARMDGFRNTADQMAGKLSADLQDIRRTLMGS